MAIPADTDADYGWTPAKTGALAFAPATRLVAAVIAIVVAAPTTVTIITAPATTVTIAAVGTPTVPIVVALAMMAPLQPLLAGLGNLFLCRCGCR